MSTPGAPRVVITGANGFVGRQVVRALVDTGVLVAGLVRSDSAARVVEGAGGEPIVIDALRADVLTDAFEGAQAVVHLAQIGAERHGASYEAVNVEGTSGVAAACRRVGVGRVVFLSGLGVAHYGMRDRCTNPYFLSKLTAESILLRSGVEVAVFRPSYILGGGLVADLLGQLSAGVVELVGPGGHRMQPVCVDDAAALIARVATDRAAARHRVFDLVGPEAISLREFVARLAAVARSGEYATREVTEAEADRRARSGGYRGMLPDELDCLLCDEVGAPEPLEALLGRPLLGLDATLRAIAVPPVV